MGSAEFIGSATSDFRSGPRLLDSRKPSHWKHEKHRGHLRIAIFDGISMRRVLPNNLDHVVYLFGCNADKQSDIPASKKPSRGVDARDPELIVEQGSLDGSGVRALHNREDEALSRLAFIQIASPLPDR